MNNVITIIGARPQFIKAAPVSIALQKAGINETIVHTGQHFDKNMSNVFFDEMKIPKPKYNLGIHSMNHSAMTGSMMVQLEKILLKESPDVVLVFGDTNSTLAGALTSRKLGIPLAHVEAGLRSYNRDMPEEINRIVTDHISNYLFCPTQIAYNNAYSEDLQSKAIISLSGDVMYDALLQFKPLSKHPNGVPKNDYILCTLHRQENTEGAGVFKKIVDTLNSIALSHQIILPAHPRIRNKLSAFVLHKNIHLIEPVGYLEMISLLSNSSLVMTDSGGLQKEAYFSKKYCLTLRQETEWLELVENGYNIITNNEADIIAEGIDKFYGEVIKDSKMLYGMGNASELISQTLKNPEIKSIDSTVGLPDRDLKKNLGCG